MARFARTIPRTGWRKREEESLRIALKPRSESKNDVDFRSLHIRERCDEMMMRESVNAAHTPKTKDKDEEKIMSLNKGVVEGKAKNDTKECE